MTRDSLNSTLTRLLVVEDDPGVIETVQRIFARYSDRIEVRTVQDAGHAVDLIRSWSPDGLFLDLMVPYGSAVGLLEGRSDGSMLETGIRLLEWIREQEREQAAAPLWVAAVTARSEPAVLARVDEALGGHGELFLKPFDTLSLEWKVCDWLGIRCDLPPEIVEELVGSDSERRRRR